MAAPDYYVHPSAVVDPGARIGPGTKIWHFAHVMSGAVIGGGCVVGQGCYIGNVRIGERVRIQNNVSVYDGVTLEDDVFAGPSCVFTNVLNPRAEVERKHEFRPTLVRRGATIGANATIVCGAVLEPYAFIGAGAVVRGEVAAHALMVGVPARRIGWMCACGERLDQAAAAGNYACAACGREYARIGDGLAALRSPGA
ncbi:acyltransferase [Haliangium ochraceum]|uniref:Transferase hexapeptide repeat containing protein n=1 Tax=Haliangium ochraceum (strain DSM 14365 / JCM 11303 / SMP-2) TaxID=502025 RepID=D0LUJ6_HALO1|nr:acyltransferase [Haliangium ochraceum]ACY19319.1 transferase hexapeptide repeat containing protein [Haliangium ochraceum DSM 14365]